MFFIDLMQAQSRNGLDRYSEAELRSALAEKEKRRLAQEGKLAIIKQLVGDLMVEGTEIQTIESVTPSAITFTFVAPDGTKGAASFAFAKDRFKFQ